MSQRCSLGGVDACRESVERVIRLWSSGIARTFCDYGALISFHNPDFLLCQPVKPVDQTSMLVVYGLN